ncbi:TonB family protein [Pseudoalteromonas luteoviolacea]|uniref:Protein TonB n=1 Tax=Pseudoalteromonas luteoviolacea DSM 6061 TaxID=1365250 RepID=A0A167D961_9GAMM|nr:TonB family protein [Pseudoalteromonas luteoviolacea]KZN48562.1 hypothetical protein N475_05920 [Pseudoalteromonas luteoviolacea DSM 6061]MBE0388736.1 hypothetical protein [Pseudoalteromonas luteoviolacea DSM 6061]
MKANIFLMTLLVVFLGGCKSVQSTNEKTMSELCQPLTYRCHAEQKLSEHTKEVWATVVKTHTFVTEQNALRMLNGLTANTNLDKALIYKRKAEIKNKMGNYKESLEDNLKAQELDVLDATSYRSLLLLEIRILFVLEDFNATKDRANKLWQYLEQAYNPHVATMLAYIAQKEGNITEYDKWVLLIKQNEPADRAARLLSALPDYSGKQMKGKPASVYTSTGKYPKDIPQFDHVERGPKAPKVTSRKGPRYPLEAAQKAIEGKVAMTYDINAKGEPINIKVVYAYPEGVFENAGVEALKSWRYEVNLDASGKVIEGKGFNLVLSWALE